MRSASDWRAVEIGGSRSALFRAAASGHDYRVSVWIPSDTPPPAGFPVIVVLDGNAMFGTFVEGIRRSSRRSDVTGVAASAVIAIACGDSLYSEERQRDFTFGPAAEHSESAGEIGGGEAFLDFLVDQLMPQLRAELPLDPARQTLFGHSLGGLFVLESLAARPSAFAAWSAISPSIWWDPAGVRARLTGGLPAESAPQLLLAVGELEELPVQPGSDVRDSRRARRAMITNAADLVEVLSPRFAPGRLQFRVFPGEDHASILMIGAQRTMRLGLPHRH